MPTQYDFKKEWEKTRNQLVKFSKEATKVAQKGEKELIAFSRKSKLHVDSTAISLKKEHLYYLVGKEYIKSDTPFGKLPTPAQKVTSLRPKTDSNIGMSIFSSLTSDSIRGVQ